MQEKEIWKDVVGYEGLYQVSNLGRVKSLDRIVIDSGKYDRIRKFRGLVLKPKINKQGYYTVNLSKNNKKKTFKMHQLVAIYYLNHTPCGHDLVVDHIDNNALNNYYKNLRIVTQRRNTHNQSVIYSSKYIGVSRYLTYGRWQSSIKVNSKSINLGIFDNEHEAHLAYQKALKEIS
jgi:hypothetical protein